ncbi:MAG: hypothetical protein R8G66_17770 [Cytophagales bacterium]|nr:hypothetical protein [Cytophagales bacterium]
MSFKSVFSVGELLLLGISFLFFSCGEGVEGFTKQGDVVLKTQQELNAFASNRYARVNGDLLIGALFEESDITDLTGLGSLNEVNGHLTISQTKVKDLRGLTNVQRIDSGLLVFRNQELTAIDVFSQLSHLGRIAVNHNNQMTTMAEFDRLESLGDVAINDNDRLTTISGFDGLQTVVRDLHITSNPSLAEIRFENLNAVGRDLWIIENHSLSNFKGFTNLKRIDRSFTLRSNHSLVSLEGLNIEEVGNNFHLVDHPSLTDIEQLGHMKIRSLFFGSNESITSLDVFSNIEELFTLSVSGKNLTSLDFPELVSIESTLIFQQLGSLTSLQGFPKLRSVGNRMYLNDNPVLKEFGESSLLSIASIIIEDNPELINLQGLESLASVEEISLLGPGITDFSGLSNIDRLQELFIRNNPNFNSFAGLDGLVQVDRIFASDNVALTSLEGLNGLEQVNVSIELYGNSQLSDFCAVSPLFSDGTFTSFIATGNAYDPLPEDLVSGDCKQ